jgi:hypothetical protein
MSADVDTKAKDLRRVTAVALGSSALILLVWDVIVAYNDVQGDTISELVRDLSHAWYVLPYVFGIVTGHFFWNRPASEMLPKAQHLNVFFAVVVGSSALVLLRDLVNIAHPMPAFAYANLTLVTVGFFVGAKFWPQAIPEKKEPQDA